MAQMDTSTRIANTMETALLQNNHREISVLIVNNEDLQNPPQCYALPSKSTLMSQAEQLKVTFAEDIASLDAALLCKTDQILNDFRTWNIINKTSSKDLQPANFSFANQGDVITRLYAIIAENKSRLLDIEIVSLSLEMKSFRLKESYNEAINHRTEKREELYSELYDLFFNTEVRALLKVLSSRQKEYNAAKEARNEAFASSLSGDAHEALKESVAGQLSQKTKALFEIVKDTQALIKETRKSRDEKAIDDRLRQMSDLDIWVVDKMHAISPKVPNTMAMLEGTQPKIDYYEKEISKYRRYLEFAKLLEALGGPFPFFRLPREVRDMIYKLAFCSPNAATRPFRSHPLYSVSSQFQQEAGKIFYESNAISCRHMYQIPEQLGHDFLQGFRESIREVHLTWASLGRSTVAAVKVLETLPGLRVLHIYINWKQVELVGCNTYSGIETFKRLLVLPNLVGPSTDNQTREIKVFQFQPSWQEHQKLTKLSISQGLSDIDEEKSRDSLMIVNKMFTQRLLADGELSQCVKSMTEDELDRKLESAMTQLGKRDRRERIRAERKAELEGRAPSTRPLSTE